MNLSTGNLFCSPYADDSIDVVYTAHSLEPNGGREEEGLRELYRVAAKYLVLFEPGYELAAPAARERMQSLGYVTKLYSTAKSLGYKIVEHKLLDYSLNPQNPTCVLVIEKGCERTTEYPLCCPITHTRLERNDHVMFAKESYLMYPIVGDIPCLLPENAIIGVNYNQRLEI